MKSNGLQTYRKTDFLRDGHASVLNDVFPLFDELIDTLSALPENAERAHLLKAFEHCLQGINQHGDDIETEERETILGAIYEIGSIVGLDPESEFAEAWRGDW